MNATRRVLRRAIAPIVEALEGRQLLSTTALFTGGNSSSTVDAYPGEAGSGWATAWTTETSFATITSASTASTSPLNSGANYMALSTNSTSTNAVAGISRGYSTATGLNTGSTYMVTFDYRVDSSLSSFTTTNDRAVIFGDSTATYGTSGTNTWVVAAYGATNGSVVADDWGFQNGDKLGDSTQTFVDTGVPLVQGRVYHFAITVNPTSNSYTATVSDGQTGTGHSYSSSTLGFRTSATFNSSTTTYVNFDDRRNASSQALSYSFDSLTLSGIASSAPSTPTGLSATPISASQVNLAWTAAGSGAGLTGYKIDRSTSASGPFTQIAIGAPDAASFSDTGLTAGTTYYYEIAASNSDGDSTYTSAVSAIANNIPAAPSGLTATASSPSHIGLSWTSNSTNQTGFKVERSTDGTTYTLVTTTSASATSYTDTSLADGTKYYYEVIATNGTGDSAASSAATATTPLSAPTGLTATASGTQINLTWTINSIDQSGFLILRSTDGTTYSTVTTTASTATTYSDTGLTAGTKYYYEVEATDSATTSPAATANATLVPAAPGSFTATAASSSQINLSWSDVTGETGFVVQRSPNGSSSWTQIATPATGVLTYSDTGLSSSTMYYYRIEAVNSTGSSAWSSTASASTNGVAPAAPSGLSATANSSTQITLAWTNNATNQTGFKVERSTSSGGAYTQIGTTTATVTTYVDTGVSAGTAYYYRVRATNASGDSAYTTVASATTPNTSTVALFTGGNGTSSSDQVPGTSGNGWATAWTTTSYQTTVNSASVISTSPLNDGSNYDSVTTTTLASATVAYGMLAGASRAYSSANGVSTGATHVVSFDYRLDSGISGFTAINDRVMIFGDSTAIYGQATSNTWVVGAYGATDGALPALTWGFQNGDKNGDSSETFTSTGVPLVQGTVYHFVITVNPTTNTYTATISDGLTGTGHTYTSGTLGFHTGTSFNSSTNTYINFTDRRSTTSAATTFSVDSLTISPVASSVPATPAGLTATAASSSSVNLGWTAGSGLTGYKIGRSTSASGPFTQIAIAAPDATSFNDTGLTAGTTYYYEIAASNSAGDSTYTSAVSATPNGVPAAPSGLTATASSPTQIALSWTSNSTNQTGFKVERSTDGTTYTLVTTTSASATSYTDTSLADGTKYYYEVIATNGTGDSAASSAATATTPLSAPTGLTATASGTQINLTWTINSIDQSGFLILRSTDGTTYSTVTTTASTATTYSDTGLTAGTKYYYEVEATDSATTSPAATANATLVPAAPGSFTATAASSSQINLSWSDVTGETGFVVQRSPNGSSSWTQIATPATGVLTYSDTGRADGTTYYYRVLATNGGGTSAPSSSASATTALPAPSSLSATTVSGSEIDLAWTINSVDQTGFVIERSTDGTTFTTLTTTGASSASYDDTSLTAGMKYYYRVHATDSVTSSPVTAVASATTLPSAPGSLSATASSASQINLSWSDVTGETGFLVERSPNGTTGWAQIGTTSTGTTTYSDAGLSASTAYYYRVRAADAGGDSPYSTIASTITFAGIPAAPSGLTATASSPSHIGLSWTSNSTNQTGFKVERSTDGTTYTLVTTTSASATSYTDTSLADGTKYYYEVIATNGTGDSAASSAATATTPLSAPTGLTATASGTQINLTWTINSIDQSGFLILRSTDGTTYSTVTTTASTATTYSDTGLTAGTKYYYEVEATDSATTSPAATANATLVPAAPGSFTATAASSSQINLSWSDVTGETGFVVQRSPNGSSSWTQIATPATGVLTYSDTGLGDGTTYYYRVLAVNAGGSSGSSAIASATTVLPAPSALTATTVSGSEIDLAWTINSANQTGFVVERSTDGTTFSTLTTTTAAANTYNDTGLTAATKYYYRVHAIDSATISTVTAVASATTVPAAPGTLNASAISSSQISLIWSDVTGETGFLVERSPNGTAGWTQIGTTSAGATNYTDSGLSASAAYYYRVRAVDAGGDSPYSPIASATTESALAVFAGTTDFPALVLNDQSTSGLKLGSFTMSGDVNASTPLTALVAWGDGTITSGSVVAESSTVFNVMADHSYPKDGVYLPLIQLSEIVGSTAVPVAFSATYITVEGSNGDGQLFTSAGGGVSYNSSSFSPTVSFDQSDGTFNVTGAGNLEFTVEQTPSLAVQESNSSLDFTLAENGSFNPDGAASSSDVFAVSDYTTSEAENGATTATTSSVDQTAFITWASAYSDETAISNSGTDDYTTSSVGSSTPTFTTTSVDQTQSATSTQSDDLGITVTSSGNSVTGDYTTSEIDTGAESSTSTSENQESSATSTENDQVATQTVNSGNFETGVYATTEADGGTTTIAGTNTDQSQSVSSTQTDQSNSTVITTGNDLTGDYIVTAVNTGPTTLISSSVNQTATDTSTQIDQADTTLGMTGNNLSGDYTNTDSDTSVATTTSTGSNQSKSATTTEFDHADTTANTSGNDLTGAYQTSQIDTGTSTVTSVSLNQSVTATSTQSDQADTTISSTGNEITGDYTSSESDNGSSTSAASGVNQTQSVVSTGTDQADNTTTLTGNSITALSTSVEIDGGTSTVMSTSTDQSQSEISTQISAANDTVTSMGNNITGNYTTSDVDQGTSTATTTNTNQTQSAGSTQTIADNDTTSSTGGNISGVYTASDVDTGTTTIISTSTDQSLSEASTQTTSGNETSSSTGNNITGDYTTSDVDQGTSTTTSNSTNQTQSSTSSQTVAANDTTMTTGDNVTGDYTASEIDHGIATVTATSSNQTQTVTSLETDLANETTTTTGNNIIGGYTVSDVDLGTSTTTSDSVNQTQSGTSTQFSAANNTSTTTGNNVTSTYTTSAIDGGTVTLISSSTNQQESSNSYSISDPDTTDTSTGNSVTGTYTSSEYDQGTATTTSSSADQNQSTAATGSQQAGTSITSSGNNITGSYTTSEVDLGSSTSTTTTSDQNQSTTSTQTEHPNVATASHGNNITGNYTTSSTDTGIATITNTSTDQSQYANSDSFDYSNVITTATGNQLTGLDTTTNTDHSSATVYSTASDQSQSSTSTETDSANTITTSSSNDVTGDYTTTQSNFGTSIVVTSGFDKDQSAASTSTDQANAVTTSSGNNIDTEYTSTETELGSSTILSASSDSSQSTSSTETASPNTTVQGSGDTITGESTTTTVDQGSMVTTTTSTSTSSSSTSTETDTANTTLVSVTDDLSGDYTQTSNGTVNSTIYETGNRNGAYTVSSNFGTTTNLYETGDSYSGTDTSTVTTTNNDSTSHTGGGVTVSQTTLSTDVVSTTSNEITGGYTSSTTDNGTVTLIETNSSEAMTQTSRSNSSMSRTGNSISGSYSDTGSSSLLTYVHQSGTNANGTYSVYEYGDNNLSAITDSGNTITGTQTGSETGTTYYYLDQTNTAASKSYTLFDEGNGSFTEVTSSNAIDGTSTTTTTGTDNYTLSQISQITAGDTVTNDSFYVNSYYEPGDPMNDQYTTVATENIETGAFSTDTSGTDYYYDVLDTSTTDNSTTPPTQSSVTETSSSGTHTFDSNETGNRYAGTITLSQTGEDRYGLLPVALNNTSDGSNGGSGMLDYSPVGSMVSVQSSMLPEGVFADNAGSSAAPASSAAASTLNGFTLTGSFWHDLPVEIGDVLGNWFVGVAQGDGVGSWKAPQTEAGAEARDTGVFVGVRLHGAGQVAQGVGEVALGLASSETGVGVLLAIQGADLIGTGTGNVITGAKSSTLESLGLQAAGMSQKNADFAVGLSGAMMTLGASASFGAAGIAADNGTVLANSEKWAFAGTAEQDAQATAVTQYLGNRFAESGGTWNVANQTAAQLGKWGSYNTFTNTITVASDATRGTILEELIHFRQAEQLGLIGTRLDPALVDSLENAPLGGAPAGARTLLREVFGFVRQ